MENISAQGQLSVAAVTSYLTMAFNASENILETSSSANQTELASYGNLMLKTSETLVSTLVKPTNTSDNVSFTLAAVEGQVFMVGPEVTLDKIPRLDTKNSSVEIDLIGIAKNNDEKSASVAFLSYSKMENLLKPDFFNTSNNTTKTMMSTVISATLPKTTKTELTKPVNFTLKHIRELDPNGSLSCVYWNASEWVVDGCSVLKTNSSFTVCSCVHLSTFALIMQLNPPEKPAPEKPPSKIETSDSLLEMLNLVCVIVGLVFFSLALLTFALCQWSPGVNNVARVNICITLLLAHLLFLLTQQFLSLIRPQQVLCTVISGVLHFLFLSGFVWMFIEAVLLFICVTNLSRISSKKREVLSNGFMCVIGYTVALVVVSVSVGLVPEGYGSQHCWIKIDKGFIWSFLGPVSVILSMNMILFISIIIRLNSTLQNLNAEISQMKQAKIIAFKTLAQFVVLGCSWILGFFINGSKELEILFLILNSQQGTFIFLIYCVLNNEVRQQYSKCFRRLCCGLTQH
ncbi:adhesion G protein-coupled receptor E3-like [Pimephales promelas]|uniref:adhesion G protein-coupled receptor E3-like n=1 Tax=Pimephales promelas TaxID=90988 RepID=UPI001955E812|nr:adhesion G protein-coupled receptor E3-like [Pimephales promelas]